ncbi:MAG: hypothetical protein JWM87_4586 [Candidatus Eremiobacteraeota bacterium]|nr:hypothetical protein [Candidatus Eremiobacteraeota bacterium]
MDNARDQRLFEARYDIASAARFIHMNPSTLRNWAHGTRAFQPVLELPQRGFLSFINLTEAYVLHAMRRRYEIPLPRVRTAIDYVEREMGVDHPLAFQQFKTDKVDLFVETAAGNVNASKRGQLRHAALMALERVEWESNRPVALFPLLRERDDSRPVKISPFIAFGQPVISGTRIPTQVISQRFHAGESIEELARDYRLQKDKIEEAVRAESLEPEIAA